MPLKTYPPNVVDVRVIIKSATSELHYLKTDYLKIVIFLITSFQIICSLLVIDMLVYAQNAL